MGQAAKTKARRHTGRATGVQLEELDYLRLTHVRGKVDAALLAGQQSVRAAIDEAEKPVAAARAQAVTMLETLGAKYGFDPRVSHRFDDERRRLIPEA